MLIVPLCPNDHPHLSVKLRVLSCVELYMHRKEYKQEHKAKGFDLVSPSFETALRDTASKSGFSSAWTVQAASTVIKKKIRSIFPPVNGQVDATAQILNTTVSPINLPDCTSEVKIMWTRLGPSSGNVWTPNHFVPLVPITPPLSTHRRQSASITPVVMSTAVTDHAYFRTGDKIQITTPVSFSTALDDHDYFPDDDTLHTEKDIIKEAGGTICLNDGSDSDDVADPELYAYMMDTDESTSNAADHDDTCLETSFHQGQRRSETTEIPIQLQQPGHPVESDSIPSHMLDSMPSHRGEPCQAESPKKEDTVFVGEKLQKNEFMEIKEILQVMSRCEDPVHTIPSGCKENVFFVLEFSENLDRRTQKKHVHVVDDCGVWDSQRGSSPRHIYLCEENHQLTKLYQKDGKYCIQKMIKKKNTLKPIHPQPSDDKILQVHRVYNHAKAGNYRRRVTWISKLPASMGFINPKLATVEYVGKFPGLVPHGNSKRGKVYERSDVSVLDEIGLRTQSEDAHKVYTDMKLSKTLSFQPRNLKQVQNKQYNERRKAKGVPRGNLADHVQHLDHLIYSCPFVQQVIRTKSKVPSVILYTEEQILDIRRFCATHPSNKVTVLGVDKTFNLGELHVTTTNFKHLALIRPRTGDHPIFLGPTFIHGNSDFESYLLFFSKLAGKLFGTTKPPVWGSDDEQAMRKAIKCAFPSCTQLICVRHLKNNCIARLRDKVGVNATNRATIIDSIFGATGLVRATSMALYEMRRDICVAIIRDMAPTFLEYFQRRVEVLLQENLQYVIDHPHSKPDWWVGESGL